MEGAGQCCLQKAGSVEMHLTRRWGRDFLDIGPNHALLQPLRVGIFCDRLSGILGLFPTFHVAGLVPGNGQGL